MGRNPVKTSNLKDYTEEQAKQQGSIFYKAWQYHMQKLAEKNSKNIVDKKEKKWYNIITKEKENK